MGAQLCVEGSRALLLSHGEGSRPCAHLQGLLKLLLSKSLFLKFPSTQRGSEPGSSKADSWLVITTSRLQNTFSAFSFPISKPSIFKWCALWLSVPSDNRDLWKTARQWLKSEELICNIPRVIPVCGG